MQILIVDLGSQHTPLIGRAIRDLGVRSITLAPAQAAAWLEQQSPKGIILSGGDASIYDPHAPKPPDAVLESGQPVLGICYGMHWLADRLGGRVESPVEQRGYGREFVTFLDHVQHDRLFARLSPQWSSGIAVMSHGDSVTVIPPGFRQLAESHRCKIAAMASIDRLIWGVQFHPEVKETEFGQEILDNFLRVCGTERDWQTPNRILGIRNEIARAVPPPLNAILAFSGGVDSTTLAALAAPVLGARLTCITIDHGGLRAGERDEIHANGIEVERGMKAEKSKPSFHTFSRNLAFLKAIATAGTDAEAKRHAFRKQYAADLMTLAAESDSTVLLQGTLAPDRIESGSTGGAKIKTHHNDGLDIGLDHVEPLSDLYKYEVRELARELGLPHRIAERKPFPGPGLYCRIVGLPVTTERLELVRWADVEVRRVVAEQKLEDEFDQLVVALQGTAVVGVKGDARGYGPVIGIRAVKTIDYMTARGYRFPEKARGEFERRLLAHREICGVQYDEADKPPRTIEFE